MAKFATQLLGLGLLIQVVSGCGGNPSGRLPISGEVNFAGEPLDKGTIDFRPVANGKGLTSGAAVVEGAFTIDGDRGLPPGEYEVRVYSSKSADRPVSEEAPMGGTPPAIERLPASANSRTTLRATVTAEGPNQFVFDIPAR